MYLRLFLGAVCHNTDQQNQSILSFYGLMLILAGPHWQVDNPESTITHLEMSVIPEFQ